MRKTKFLLFLTKPATIFFITGCFLFLAWGLRAFEKEKVLLESNFSDLETNWEVWDDPAAENRPSHWKVGIAELSGLYNDQEKIATVLLAGEKTWQNYSIESTFFCVDNDPYLTGFVFGYQDSEHFYAVGYNFYYQRYELEIKSPHGFEILATHEAEFPWKKEVLLRLDYAGNRIRFLAENQLIFDVEDNRYPTGQFGLGTSNLGRASVLIGPITVTSLSPDSQPEKGMTSINTSEELIPTRKGEPLFKEDFSSGNLDRWQSWDDAEAYYGPSKWAIVLSDYSGIYNRSSAKPTTSLLTGERTWKNYSVQSNLFASHGRGLLTGIVFGYQDEEHFYHIGYNFSSERFELEAQTPEGFELLSSAETEFPSEEIVPLRVDFAANRILFRVKNQIIFDIEDDHHLSGRVGITSAGLDDGAVVLNGFKVVSFDPESFPKKQLLDLLSSRKGAAVIYREFPPLDDQFRDLIDHSLLNKEDMGNDYGLDFNYVTLPEEAVFCFPQGRFVEIRKIGFKLDDESFPKKIRFSCSNQTPKSGFKPLITTELKPEPESYQEFDVPPTTAKYLKIQITQGYDPEYMSIQEMFVKGYYKELSIEPGAGESLGEIELQEKEPNNSISEAQLLPLGAYLGGKTTRDDIDYYHLSLKEQAGYILRFYFNTTGFLRPYYALLSKDESFVEPSEVEAVGNKLAVTYTVEPDVYYLKIVQPETYLSIVYDDSSSMGNSVPTVKRVLKGYLENLGEGLNLKLMKYTDEAIELSDFTNDPELLKKAITTEIGGGGGTDAFVGLNAAIDSVKAMEGNRAILAILDDFSGMASDYLSEYIKLWNNILESGVILTTIGIQTRSRWWDEKTSYFDNSQLRIFSEFAYSTGGQLFRSPSDEIVEKSAQTIFNQLTAPVEYRVKAEVKKKPKVEKKPKIEEKFKLPGSIQILFEKAVEKEVIKNVELILDASNSMWGQIEGKSKIEIAREVLSQIIDGLPEKMNVGLRAYGHRYPLRDARACQDTELVVSIGPLAKSRLIEIISNIKPKGKTPLVYSVLQSVKDFQAIEKGTVVLISDGIESCGGDKNEIAPALKESGLDLRVHIVGFGIEEKEARKELETIAQSTGGIYLDAKDSQELLSSLEQTLQVEFLILDEAGKTKAKGFVGGKEVKIPEGTYILRLMLEPQPLEKAVTIKPEEKSLFHIEKEKGKWAIKEKE
jgi:hypothetical protein